MEGVSIVMQAPNTCVARPYSSDLEGERSNTHIWYYSIYVGVNGLVLMNTLEFRMSHVCTPAVQVGEPDLQSFSQNQLQLVRIELDRFLAQYIKNSC